MLILVDQVDVVGERDVSDTVSNADKIARDDMASDASMVEDGAAADERADNERTNESADEFVDDVNVDALGMRPLANNDFMSTVQRKTL